VCECVRACVYVCVLNLCASVYEPLLHKLANVCVYVYVCVRLCLCASVYEPLLYKLAFECVRVCMCVFVFVFV